ncbi:MAG: aldehyde dehydrogenase [Phycisphaerales bacterium JB063]
MSATDTKLIHDVVTEVLSRLNAGGVPAAAKQPTTFGGSAASADGIFTDVDQAVQAASDSQKQLAQAGLDVRDGIVKLIKTIVAQNAQSWGRFELDETNVGRLDHKIAKLELLARVPGVEFLRAKATVAHSGDKGVALDEAAPFGVIGCITPVTHSIPTMTANAINMIASGNAMVVNPHPSGTKSAVLAAKTYNAAIRKQFGIGPLCCVIEPPSLDSAKAIFAHRGIPLLVVTGGPAVARVALKQPKRAIVAGPGNPPVVVDETADLDNAARSIIAGAAFDNNLLCIGEKEVFVVDRVFDKMMDAMARAGAARLNDAQVVRLTESAMQWKNDHHVASAEFIGKDAHVLANAAGLNVGQGIDLLFGETDDTNPFVPVEQMMPFVPFVRCRDFDEALRLALKHEHGFGHTAIIHSNHLEHITRMGRAMNTTIFVANGPCTAGLGSGGEGYASYSIATPTGEGITTPLTFTRFRRNTIAGALRIV